MKGCLADNRVRKMTLYPACAHVGCEPWEGLALRWQSSLK